MKENKEVKEGIRLIGKLIIQVFRKGKLVEQVVKNNLIVDVGIAQIAGLINGVVTTPFTYVAVGSGTTAPTSADTALENELLRGLATTSRTTTTKTNDTARWEITWTAESDMTITEAGIFDASTNGNMLARQTFTAVSVATGEQFRVIWEITVS